jgi:hypothetical protein
MAYSSGPTKLYVRTAGFPPVFLKGGGEAP